LPTTSATRFAAWQGAAAAVAMMVTLATNRASSHAAGFPGRNVRGDRRLYRQIHRRRRYGDLGRAGGRSEPRRLGGDRGVGRGGGGHARQGSSRRPGPPRLCGKDRPQQRPRGSRHVGAEKRYNYTAVGETVNIAARLESVPGDYAGRIVVGPATAAAIAERFVVIQLDWIKVKGKEEALAVYEMVASRTAASPAALQYLEQYGLALEHYRAGDFAAAEESWRRIKHPYLDGPPRP
jgi:hypothetical protein